MTLRGLYGSLPNLEHGCSHLVGSNAVFKQQLGGSECKEIAHAERGDPTWEKKKSVSISSLLKGRKHISSLASVCNSAWKPWCRVNRFWFVKADAQPWINAWIYSSVVNTRNQKNSELPLATFGIFYCTRVPGGCPLEARSPVFLSNFGVSHLAFLQSPLRLFKRSHTCVLPLGPKKLNSDSTNSHHLVKGNRGPVLRAH